MGIEINKETLDYLRDELSSAIRESVEPAIFRYYRNLAATVVLVLGAAGITVGIPELLNIVRNEVRSQVDTIVQPTIDKARADAEKLRENLDKTEASAEITLQQLQRTLDQFQADVHKNTNELRSFKGDIDDAKKMIADQIEASKTSLKNLDASLSARSAALDQVFASIGVTDALSNQVKTLNDQVNALSVTVKDLAAKADHAAAVTSAGAVSEATKAIDTQLKSLQSSLTAQTNVPSAGVKPTVFVQFAGASRSQIRQLTDALRASGAYYLPGEERTDAAANKHEIRYYYPNDAEAAKSLQSQVNDALRQLNYSVQIDEPSPQWLTYPQKPKQGVIELWLSLPTRAAAD